MTLFPAGSLSIFVKEIQKNKHLNFNNHENKPY